MLLLYTQTKTKSITQKHSPTASMTTTEEKDRWEKATAPHLPLYMAAQRGEWETLRKSIRDNVISIDTPISRYRENLLHVIVCQEHGNQFLKELTEAVNFDPDVLLKGDYKGKTPLCFAATAGNTEAARIIVQRNPALLKSLASTVKSPVYVAARLGHKETVRFFIMAMKERPDNRLGGKNGVQLLNLLITVAFYDLALVLLNESPEFAYGEDCDRNSPLDTFVQRPLILRGRIDRHREEAIQLIRAICIGIRNYTLLPDAQKTASNILKTPFLEAARLGIYEIVIEIINIWPYMVFARNEEHMTIYHFAVEYRHENIFNHIWILGSNMHRILTLRNNDGTNILHLAARLGGSPVSHVSGAALQMQRDLQWFKVIENITEVSLREKVNYESRTPWMVFTDAHKDLLKAGEEWMKKAASACTVVAALIVTVVFAAAFTVLGGNDSKGIPIFLHNPYFIMFAISNSIALFSSSTSLIMFLSILTSRYSEIDFLHSLPNKLCIGLCTLFLSILCMLIAFSGALYLYLVHLSKYVMIPIFLSMCVPAVLFLFLQFPLLKEIAYSTYGPSIFHEPKSSKTNLVPVRVPIPIPAPTPISARGRVPTNTLGPSDV